MVSPCSVSPPRASSRNVVGTVSVGGGAVLPVTLLGSTVGITHYTAFTGSTDQPTGIIAVTIKLHLPLRRNKPMGCCCCRRLRAQPLPTAMLALSTSFPIFWSLALLRPCSWHCRRSQTAAMLARCTYVGSLFSFYPVYLSALAAAASPSLAVHQIQDAPEADPGTPVLILFFF